MGYPACFESSEQYSGWTSLARLSREVVSICSDCSPEYREKMTDQKRCVQQKWSKILFNRRGDSLEKALPNIPVTTEKKAIVRKPMQAGEMGSGRTPRQWFDLSGLGEPVNLKDRSRTARKKADKGEQGLES